MRSPPKLIRRWCSNSAWTIIPSLICVVLFVWSSSLYVRNSRPPAASTEIFVIGKQWMWHLQHPEGPREINELHVPVGVPVKLTMTSQDVIHDFYIPAFRVKKDVLPGRYSSIWFQATETGTYHLFCAQYCGTEPLRDDRLGVRDDADRLRGMARRRREDRIHGRSRASVCSSSLIAEAATSPTAVAEGRRWRAFMASRKSWRAAKRASWMNR